MQETTLITSIVTCLFIAYSIFFKSYFNEKGKNLATKQDISEITLKIETIKNELGYVNQSKFNLKIEERKALIECYEKYSVWLNDSLHTYLGGIYIENSIKLDELENKLNKSQTEFELARAKMELLVDNEEVTALSFDLKIKTLELQHLTNNVINDFQMLFVNTTIKISEQPQNKISLIKEMVKQQTESIRQLADLRMEHFKKIGYLDRDFQILIFNHLKSDLNV